MDINRYEAFIRTVELGSLTKAGEILGYTQSGISHILNSLESDCGVRLLIRDRTGVRLSSAGKELYPYIKSVCDSERRFQEELDAIHGIESGLIRIGTISSVSTHWLPGLIRSFRDAHPHITFDLWHGEYSEIEAWIRHEEVDMGFINEPPQTNVNSYFLMRDPMVAVLPKGHELTAWDAVPHAKLKEYPFLLYIGNLDNEIKDILDRYDIVPNSQLSAKDDYAIMAMVESGLGISVLPKLVLERCPYDIEIRELDPPAYRDLAIATKPNVRLTPAAASFLKFIRSADL